MTDDPDSYGLVMPFVPVASHGGPFDDQAYSAGYEMGLLDALLGHAYTFGKVFRTVLAANQEQADLLAMRHGVGSSRVDLQACKLEYSIVSPK